MKVGLDTGFLLKLYAKERKVVAVWKRFLGRDTNVVTSLLCGYEFFKVLSLRGIPFIRLREFWDGFKKGVEVAGVSEESIQKGARLEARYRLGAMDSLILAGLLEAGCREVFTTDGRWKERVQEIKIRLI